MTGKTKYRKHYSHVQIYTDWDSTQHQRAHQVGRSKRRVDSVPTVFFVCWGLLHQYYINNIDIHTFRIVQIYIMIYICIHIYIYISYTYNYTYAYMYTHYRYAHTHTHIYIYIYVRVCTAHAIVQALFTNLQCQVASMRVLRNLPFHEQQLARAGHGEDVGFLKMGSQKNMIPYGLIC